MEAPHGKSTLPSLVVIPILVMKTCFWLVKRKIPDISRFNPPLLFISKAHGLKEHGLYYKLRSSSPTHKAAIGQIFDNNFCQSVQKH